MWFCHEHGDKASYSVFDDTKNAGEMFFSQHTYSNCMNQSSSKVSHCLVSILTAYSAQEG